MKFVHTADWQIGKVFRFVSADKMALLQQARLDAVARLGTVAEAEGASAVLVAGDVFDMEGVSDRTLAQPFERMRAFPRLAWHLIPGNHDPHRPDGLWDRVRRLGLPANVQLHLAPEPVEIAPGAVLLPCPLVARHTLQDATQWTEQTATPPGTLRIGLAHGSVRAFGTDGNQPNFIPPDRARRSGLDWLALGDWHGAMQIDARTAYAGTPEVDGFDVENGGGAYLVEIAGAGAPPSVTRVETGRYRWIRHEAALSGTEDVATLEAVLDGFGTEAAQVLMRIAVTGALSYADLERFDRLRRRADAALFDVAIDETGLIAAPTEEDLRALDVAGPIGAVAARLKTMAAETDPARRAVAAAALRRLFVEYRLAEGAS